MRNERHPSRKFPKHVRSMPKSVGLTDSQIRALLRTKTLDPNILSAWLFVLHTGMLFKEIAPLTIGEVKNLNLNRKASNLIKKLEVLDKSNESLLFNLPPYDKCYVALRLWSAQAGLDFVAGFHIAAKTFILQDRTKSNPKP